MVKMIRGWKTMGTRVLLLGKQGYICTNMYIMYLNTSEENRVDEHITLILQFAQRICINASPKRGTKKIIKRYWEDQL